MYYKGQTILVSYVDEGEEEVKEMVGIYLGVAKDDEVLSYFGRAVNCVISTSKIDIRAIGDPKVDGGVYWGKFRTGSMSGLMTKESVLKHFKEWNKELTNAKRMLTKRNKKK